MLVNSLSKACRRSVSVLGRMLDAVLPVKPNDLQRELRRSRSFEYRFLDFVRLLDVMGIPEVGADFELCKHPHCTSELSHRLHTFCENMHVFRRGTEIRLTTMGGAILLMKHVFTPEIIRRSLGANCISAGEESAGLGEWLCPECGARYLASSMPYCPCTVVAQQG